MAHRAALAHHLIRIAACVVALIALPGYAPLLAIPLYYGWFMLTHELAHGALGLPRRWNELALAIAGLGGATSGHALRVMHMRHHAHPLTDGDLEGAAARLSAGRALVTAPAFAVALVATAWRTATARDRRWQAAEHLAFLALASTVIAAGPHALRIYLVTGVALQLLAPFWAGYLIHCTPRWLFAIARLGAHAGSLAMKTLVVHEAHHARPKLPTHVLAIPPLAAPADHAFAAPAALRP